MAESYLIKKTLNNNCMIIDVDNQEKILIGKGISFGKKSGEYYEISEQVEKVFVIENDKNMTVFQQLLHRNDEEFISFCEELIWDLSLKVNCSLNESIHTCLIDHLSCTIHRIKIGEQIFNPFLHEIEVLYANEYVLAEALCTKLAKHYNISIPKGEIGFVAIHIHSAMHNGNVRDALRAYRICNKSIEIIEEAFQFTVDIRSLDYSRFLVHLTYLLKRLNEHKTIENELAQIIIQQYKSSYAVSKKIAHLIKSELKINSLPDDELAFLTTHIERLRRSNIV